MATLKSEWPLLVFTTLSPLCGGAWIVASVLTLSNSFSEARGLTSGVAGLLLCLLLFFSLACSTLHLGKPTKALRAFMRLGNSTVSNEVFMGTLFAACLAVYLILASHLNESLLVLNILLIFATLFATLFILFQSLAYRMQTVPTWNSAAFSLEFVLIALLGGICFEGIFIEVAFDVPFEVKLVLVVVEALSCIGMLVVIHAQTTVIMRAVINYGKRRSDPKASLTTWYRLGTIRVVALVSGSILWSLGLLIPNLNTFLTIGGGALVFIGIAIGRYSFYRSYINVGLPQ